MDRNAAQQPEPYRAPKAVERDNVVILVVTPPPSMSMAALAGQPHRDGWPMIAAPLYPFKWLLGG